MIEKGNDLLGYPNPLASPEAKKQDSYGLQYFRRMYSDWAGGGDKNYRELKKRYETSRAYAQGSQNPSKYKKLLGNSGDLSYLSLNWDIVPVIPKFVDVMVGGLTNQDYEVRCTAVDKLAQDAKVQEEMRLAAKMMLKDFTKDLEVLSGIPLMGDENIPADAEELELFMQLTYKQAVEIAMEQGLELCLSLNQWKEIAKRVITDLIVIGIAATKTDSSPSGVTIRYVDPINLVVSNTSHPNHSDMFHCGEVKYYTIHDIKRLAGSKFSEADYQIIAAAVVGKYGNTKDDRINTNPMDNGSYEYDSMRVAVMEGEFKSSESITQEKKYNAHGGYSVHTKEYGYVPPKRSRYKREITTTDYEVAYTGSYIVGTNFIYGYKKAENMIRSKSNVSQVRLSYTVYKLSDKSMVDRMKPFADEIQLAHLKIQQLMAKTKPKGAAFDVDALSNLNLGNGGEMTPLQIQDIYEATGNLYFRRIAASGDPISPGAPVTELNGGIGGALNEMLAIMHHNIEQIRTVTGMGPRDASEPSKDAAVGVQKLALLASNNATRGINQAYLSILEGTAKSAALRIQSFVKYNKNYAGYIKSLGEMNLKAIEVTADVHPHDFGIVIEALPDEEEKQIMEANIQMSLSRDELRIEDAIMLRTIKNVKLANQMLVLRRRKYQEEKEQIAMKNSEMNAQIQERSAAAKAEADAALEVQKTESKKNILQAEYALKEEFAKKEHERKMAELRLEGKLKSEHIEQASSDIDADLTRIRTR